MKPRFARKKRITIFSKKKKHQAKVILNCKFKKLKTREKFFSRNFIIWKIGKKSMLLFFCWNWFIGRKHRCPTNEERLSLGINETITKSKNWWGLTRYLFWIYMQIVVTRCLFQFVFTYGNIYEWTSQRNRKINEIDTHSIYSYTYL